MTEKVPTDATRPMTRQAITARVCPGLRSNCRATYFRSMATVPGSRVAAANPRRSMRFWKDARLSTIQYARGHEKLTPRLWRRPIRISSTPVKTRNDSRRRSPLPLTSPGMNQRLLSMAIGCAGVRSRSARSSWSTMDERRHPRQTTGVPPALTGSLTPPPLNAAPRPAANPAQECCDRCGSVRLIRVKSCWRCDACGYKSDCNGW